MCKMPDQLAQHTVENYRCSKCWCFLVKTLVVDGNGQIQRTDDGETLAIVKCRDYPEHHGFVTQGWIDREKTRDFDQAFEVKRDLLKIGIITKEKAYGN